MCRDSLIGHCSGGSRPSISLAWAGVAGSLPWWRAIVTAQSTYWALEVGDWALAVAAEIEKIDRADAEWFRTLDAVPPPRVRFVDLSPAYSKTFRELDFMLVKLERLITNYSSAHIRNNNLAPNE